MMESSQENQETQSPKAGAMMRAARIAAHCDVARIAAELRISQAAFETLESGQYDRLPGDPYVRALLGSVARILHLDPLKLVAAYNEDIGSGVFIPPVTPYKDLSQTHVVAHKKYFVLILAGLLVVFLVILGKINTSHKTGPGESAERNDSLVEVTPSVDTQPESRSLRPDNSPDTLVTAIKLPVAAPVPVKDSVKPAVPEIETPVAPAVIPPVVVKTGPVLITPLVDSVQLVVKRSGKSDSILVLRLGSPLEFVPNDTLFMTADRIKCLEISVGGRTVIPKKKSFRIAGGHFTYL